MSIVPLVVVPPVVPLTDQLTALLVVPDTATENGKVSPARILAVGGDTTTLTEDGGSEGGGLVLRAVAAQLLGGKGFAPPVRLLPAQQQQTDRG